MEQIPLSHFNPEFNFLYGSAKLFPFFSPIPVGKCNEIIFMGSIISFLSFTRNTGFTSLFSLDRLTADNNFCCYMFLGLFTSFVAILPIKFKSPGSSFAGLHFANNPCFSLCVHFQPVTNSSGSLWPY